MEPYTTAAGTHETVIYLEASHCDVGAIACGVGLERVTEAQLFEDLYDLSVNTSVTPFRDDDLNFTADADVVTELIERTREYLAFDFVAFDPAKSYGNQDVLATQYAILTAQLCQEAPCDDTEDPPLVVVHGDTPMANRIGQALTGFDLTVPPITYSPKLHQYAPPAHIAQLAAHYMLEQVEPATGSEVDTLEEQRGDPWSTAVSARKNCTQSFVIDNDDVPRHHGSSTTERLHCWYTGLLGDTDGPPVRQPAIDRVYDWAVKENYESLAAFARSYTGRD